MVNPSVEKQHFIFVPHKTSMDRKTNMFRTKNKIEMRCILAEEKYVLIANDKRKWWSTAKMRASGGPAKWTPVSFMQMASNSGALSSRAMSDAGGAMLDYDCLLHLVFCFIMQ